MFKKTTPSGRPGTHHKGHGHDDRRSRASQPSAEDRFEIAINNATKNEEVPKPTTINTSRYTASRQNLRVIPMGGVEEVGENMTVLEYGDDLIVIDMGLAFPDDTM